MRKALLLLFVPVLIIACNKTKQLTEVNVDLPYTLELDAGKFPDSAHYASLPPGGLKVDFPTLPLTPNAQSYLDQYNTTANKINSVTLKSLVLQMTSPPGRNLDFLKRVTVSLSADTLATIRVAHLENIPKGQTSISLNDTSADLKPYFLQPVIYVQISATFDSIPPSGTHINAITTFHLSANPLN